MLATPASVCLSATDASWIKLLFGTHSPDPAQASLNGINCTACVKVPGFGLTGGKCEPCQPGSYADDTMETCKKWCVQLQCVLT
jgi:hypothetical protein